MNADRAQVGWSFWLWWVLASAMGLAVGFVAIFAVLEAVDETVTEAMSLATVGAVIGVSIGIAQWVVLRRKVARAGWWVVASTLGFAIALAVVGAVEVGEAVVFALSGASVGIAQWLVLRRQVSQPGWWVLASIVAVAMGFAVISAVSYAMSETEAGVVGGAGAVGGAMVGAITGGVLVWRLRQSAAKELGPSQAAE